MKTRISFLFIFVIAIASCSDKETARKYSNIRRYYEVMTPSINFVIQDQQSVFTDGLVTNFEVNPPTYRTATQEDKSKAYEVGLKAISLKGFIDEIIENCKKIEELSSKKRLFISKDDRVMIDLNKEYIRIGEESILKVTDGEKAKDFLYPYVTKTMRDSMEEFEQMMSRLK